MKFRPKLVRPIAAVLGGSMLMAVAGLCATAQTTNQSGLSTKVLVREGTEVRLKLAERVSSKNAVEGDPVNFVLDQDLKVADVVVARAGTVAVGTISHATRSGILGRPGDIGVRLDYLRIHDARLELRGSKGKQGKACEGTTVALTVLFGPVGLVKHGRNAEFNQGTSLTAYVDRDTELALVE